ncbi:hypothetical protein B1B_13596 [mine drainage metagenome]|uniref:Uncharacterized protein n=1 Tax=mine drainage metagenome TaxID=410659 RepID=T1AU93_9ZZZZ
MLNDDDLIYSYTRSQAIADGVLVDLSERGRTCGIKYPTACTSTVWALIEATPETDRDMREVAEAVRISAVLSAMLEAIRAARGTDRVVFRALGAELWAQCGPGDDGEPVITIMLEGED